MNTICNLLGVAPVKTSALPANLNGEQPILLTEMNRAIGVEFEVENVQGDRYDRVLQNFLVMTPDNSLRNNGMEFVSVPILAKDVGQLVNTFLTRMGITQENHSDRTSTHVHVNVGDFTVEQLLCLCMLYSVFEKLIFKYAGHDRENSIFCVPWYASGYSTSKAKDIIINLKGRKAARWEKYTSLNLAPIADKQTVEFRHLFGVYQDLQLVNWVNIILSLVNKARTTPLLGLQEILVELNTTSHYVHFATEVFGDYLRFMATTPEDLRASMFDGVVEAKLFIGQTPLTEKDMDFSNPAPIKKTTKPKAERIVGLGVNPVPVPEPNIPEVRFFHNELVNIPDLWADVRPQEVVQVRENIGNEAAIIRRVNEARQQLRGIRPAPNGAILDDLQDE